MMSDNGSQPGELALVKAVRSLDQKGSDTIPDRLDQIWKILSIYPGGRFHAAEEMIVRWLLKNMNGTSVAAEQLRRYPLTWRILGKVFSSIPLFSLAKSLADRRFIPILQNALKDASEPKQSGTETKDVEMVDAETDDRPLKRKRSDDVSFDIDSQRRPSGCFRTAEAMFETIRLLLSQLDSKTSSMAKQENHMGAEHIKSLFCSSAEEVKGLIVPALSICNSAISSFPQREAYEGQENWISTINDIWDLHLQGDGDAVQVATLFANTSISMLGRLTDAPPHEWRLGVNDEVKKRWTQDLKRFLTRNFILPARTAYLNREVLEIIRIAVEKTLVSSTLSCPVIFDLVLSAPHLAGGQVARRENDSWIQAVFSLLVETLQESRSPHRLAAVRDMMDKALKWDVSLSRESLQSLAKSYALSSDRPEWSLLLLIAKLNADTFIAGDDDSLLKTILDASISDQVWTDAEADEAADFLITLVDGYAKGRDLIGFLQKWFQYLASAEPHLPFKSLQRRLWYNEKLYETVSEHLEKTMNTKQILSFLDWLDAQEDGPAQNAALVLILGALSQGIRQDETVDAVGLRLHDAVLRRRLPSDVNDEVVSNKWIVARRSVEWATYQQAQRIWTDLAAGVKKELELTGPLDHDSMIEAYKFAASALVANHPGGVHEEQITSQIEVFLDGVYTGLDSKSATVSGQDAGLVARLEELWGNGFCPRLLSLIVEKGGQHSCRSKIIPHYLQRGGSSSVELFTNEDNINSRRTADELYQASKNTKGGHSLRFIALPIEILSREKREEVMAAELLPTILGQELAEPETLKAMTSAMIKIMAKPTFYKDMDFTDLDRLGEVMASARFVTHPNNKALSQDFVDLLEELTTRTLRQMTANVEKREQDYLRKAVKTATAWPVSPADSRMFFRIMLLKRLLLAVKQPSVLKVLRDVDLKSLENRLCAMIKAAVQHLTNGRDLESLSLGLPYLSTVLEATDALAQDTRSRLLIERQQHLEDTLSKLAASEEADTWTLRKFLLQASTANGQPVADLNQLLGLRLQSSQDGLFPHKETMLQCVDAVIEGADEETKLQHIETLLREQEERSARLARLLAVQRILQQLEGTRAISSDSSTASLSATHTTLCNRLRHSSSPVEFLLTTQILQHLLDEKWHSMSQWNIELTLSTISVLASQSVSHAVISTTPQSYSALCRLVQVIIRRHRLRLEGHFHILVTTLQSLLRALILHPYSSASNTTHAAGLIRDPAPFLPKWENHAKAFSRLLTMVCEPTAASVSRHGAQNSLDSATDAAKRTAGQHMYLVLMTYIKLQLEQNVPHGVREKMEPGVFSVLDVTSAEGRRVMNDALDASGRAIMKDMYKGYLKFGKWSGI